MDPENTFEMEGDVGTTKAALSNSEVPSNKFARKVYGMLINNRAAAENTLTLTIETDTTVDRTVPPITFGAYDTLDVNRPLDSPIFTMKPGQNIKAVAGSDSISVILQAYDI